jgi:small redox-active disulfide protein 2
MEVVMKKLKIFGPGCARCNKLAEHTEAAAKELGIDYEIEKVTDIDEISAAGVFVTPALAVDGELKLVGKVPTPQEIKTVLVG